MSIRTIGIVEARKLLEAQDEKPVIPEITSDGEATGHQLALDVIEAQFTFDSEDMPFIISGRVRGMRLRESDGELVYADNQVRWTDLIIGRIPKAVSNQIGELRAAAHEEWKAIRGAK